MTPTWNDKDHFYFGRKVSHATCPSFEAVQTIYLCGRYHGVVQLCDAACIWRSRPDAVLRNLGEPATGLLAGRLERDVSRRVRRQHQRGLVGTRQMPAGGTLEWRHGSQRPKHVRVQFG